MKFQKSEIILTAAMIAACAISGAFVLPAAASTNDNKVSSAAAGTEITGTVNQCYYTGGDGDGPDWFDGTGSCSQRVGEWIEENGTTRFVEGKSTDNSKGMLHLISPPDKTIYFYGEDLDLRGAVISGCGFDNEPLSEHMDMVDASAYKSDETGDYWITVHGENNVVGFYVHNVGGDSTSHCCDWLHIDDKPTKLVYQIGEKLDLTGGTFSGDYNGRYDHDKLTDHMDIVDTSEFDKTTPGEYRIYVRGLMNDDSFTVTVVGGSADVTEETTTTTTTITTTTTTTTSGTVGTWIDYEHLYIKTLPDKVVYQIGEELDLTGGMFEGNGHIAGDQEIYYDWFSAQMPNYMSMIDTSEFDNTKPGIYRIYIRGKKAKTSFTVEVVDGGEVTTTFPERTVRGSISMMQLPDKVLYFVGDALDLTGGYFTGGGEVHDPAAPEPFFYDWFEAALVDYPEVVDTSEFDSSKPGIYTIHLEDNYGCKTSFDVQVIPKLTKDSADINEDGQQTVSDAILMTRVVAEDQKVKVNDKGLKNANMDGIGGLTAEDVTLALKMLAGLL